MGNRFSKPEPQRESAPERTVISIDDTEPWFTSPVDTASPVETASSPVETASPVEEIEIIFGTD
jgi:hypothetical protein